MRAQRRLQVVAADTNLAVLGVGKALHAFLHQHVEARQLRRLGAQARGVPLHVAQLVPRLLVALDTKLFLDGFLVEQFGQLADFVRQTDAGVQHARAHVAGELHDVGRVLGRGDGEGAVRLGEDARGLDARGTRLACGIEGQDAHARPPAASASAKSLL